MNSAPSQAVELVQGGRPYGRPALSLQDRAAIEPVPEIGKIFIEDIVKGSAILKLDPDSDRPAILAAYKADLASLAMRRREADGFMKSALECGMSRFSMLSEERSREWSLLQKLLEPLGIAPQISLTAERNALPPAELVEWIKAEFLAETDRIARRIATTLHYLADHNVIGLVDWTGVDACKFHYFSWDVQHEKATSESERRFERNDGVVWVSYNKTITSTATLIRTRHTHHLVDAQYHNVADYSRPMPESAHRLIASAPKWLAQNLLVLDGTETLSEKAVAIADKATVSIESVVRYDPAIVMGPFVFAGWSEADVGAEAGSASERSDDDSFFPTIAWVVAAVGFLALLLTVVFLKDTRDRTIAYAAYLKDTAAMASGGHDEFVVKPGGRLELPVRAAVEYTRFSPMPGLSLSVTDLNGNSSFVPLTLKDSIRGTYYGDIDLMQVVGMPITLHVRKVTEGGDLSYSFTARPFTANERELQVLKIRSETH